MFDFLRSKPEPESQPEQKALPEPADDGDPAVKAAIAAALVEQALPEPEPEPAPPVTMITAETTVGGSIETRSDVVVQGVVGGDLNCGALAIEADGEVKGDVLASGDVVIRGTVLGNVSVHGKITIAATGKVIGDVNAHAIALDEGGELRGRCTMGAPKPAAKPAAAEPKADESFIGKMFEDDDVSFSPPELAVV